MILSRILSDDQKHDEACLAQSILAVARQAEDFGRGTLALVQRCAYQAAQATADSR